jgi:hypothetical protein
VVFKDYVKGWKTLDYVAGWLLKAAHYGIKSHAATAFVATNSICQGQQVPILWPLIFNTGHEIGFAHTSFKWANLASHNAGVTVAVIGISRHVGKLRFLQSAADEGGMTVKEVANINAYLVAAPNIEVHARTRSFQDLPLMQFGNHPYYGSALIFKLELAKKLIECNPESAPFIRPLYGSEEFIDGSPRACLWIEASEANRANAIPWIAARVAEVAKSRLEATKDSAAQKLAETPYRFRDQASAKRHILIIPRHSSESRHVLPVGLLNSRSIVSDAAFAMYDSPLWSLALIASRLHLVWVETVCGKLETRYRYSNTLGWNTFPTPKLTDKNKADLTRCAEDILLAREHHFPATIADLYDPETMPEDLRQAHERNDEVLERIYIGRRFKNDTERLEKLFELYSKMTESATLVRQGKAKTQA